MAPEKPRDCEDRADSHFVRLAAGDRESAEDQLVTDAKLVGALPQHEQRGRRAVGELRRVSGRHRTLPTGLVEERLQRRQSFERRVRTVAFIPVAAMFLLADGFTGLVQDGPSDMDRGDLFLEETLGLGPR